MHGGSAPQVRKAAALRLAALIDPAIGVVAKSLKSKTERVRLDAAKDVLDRNGFKDAVKIYVGGIDEAPIRISVDPKDLTDEQLEHARKLAASLASAVGTGNSEEPTGST